MECNNCGSKVKDDNIYCPNCGTKVGTKKKSTKKEEKSEVVIVDGTKSKEVDQSSDHSFLWGLLGFFVPIVGLILFLVWREEKPEDSKAAGIGALVRVGLIFVTIIICFFVLLYISRF